MNKLILAAAAAAFAIAAPATAQSVQDDLDARYDRALAAGYKALFLCSATWSAERLGGERSGESIHEYELTGIQAPLDEIVRDLPYELGRMPDAAGEPSTLWRVLVPWAEDMPPRVASVSRQGGCFLEPIGMQPEPLHESERAREAEEVPDDGWTVDNTLMSRSDADRLAGGAFGDNYGEGSRTTAALVVRNGAIALERYREGFGPDTPQRTWSVAKSIAATIVGMAVKREAVEVDLPVGIGFWRQGGEFDARNAVTIDHALRMATGRYTDTPGNRTDPLYFGGSTVDETALHWPLVHKPGTVWRYANNDTLLAVKGVQQFIDSSGTRALLGELGMDRTVIETDWRGGYILSSQVWSTARDLARLGQVHLDIADGEGTPLPADWLDYISTPSGPQPEGRDLGYGAGWWLLDRSDGVPADTIAAMGNRGQYVVVVPSRNVVIVRRGEDPVGSRFDIVSFTRDVLAALD